MEGTNINYPEPEVIPDHTYYGNGCPNSWVTNPPLNGGSTVSCSDRTVTTLDGETQDIGVYYNYGASTSGSGGTITTNNVNAPDSFCPLGWQAPYGGTGGDYYDQSKSWRYLAEVYSVKGDISGQAQKLLNYPLSFVLSGYMAIGDVAARLYNYGNNGIYSSITNEARTTFYHFSMSNSYVSISTINGKGASESLRCVTRY